MREQELLQVNNLSVCFRSAAQEIWALRGFSFSVAPDECVGIVGESGSGKSVAMKAVLGLLPESAEIMADRLEFEQRDLLRMKEREYRRLRGSEMTMIFQDPMTALDPLSTVGSHLREVLRRSQPGLSRTESKRKALELLQKVGIPQGEQRLRQYPHEFSGGMRQRVLIAMALACNPRLLIADEPTTALDVTIQAQILELLNELRKEYRSSIILISHDLGVVANLCRRIIILYGGMMMETGTAEEIFYHPRHPYTQALLRSVPTPDLKEGQRLLSIPGTPPAAGTKITGCPFAERCEHALPCCTAAKPELHSFSPTQSSACFLHKAEGLQ